MNEYSLAKVQLKIISHNRRMMLTRVNKSRSDLDILLLNLILFIYPIDKFEILRVDESVEGFSPFRLVILPLCILYLLKAKITFYKADNQKITIVNIFFAMSLIGIIAAGSMSVVSFFGNIVQFYMAYFLIHNMKFEKSTLLVMTTWVVTEVPVFISLFTSGMIGMSMRFKGMFFDPNYLCAFSIPAMWAAYYLMKENKKIFYKFYGIFIITIGGFMIFLSFSRGGMLALLVTIMIYLLATNPKKLVMLIIVSIPLISAMIVRSKFLSWSDGADNFIDGFIYRTFTLSEDMNDLTAGRSDYMQNFIDNANDYMFAGMPLESYLKSYNEGHFPHNGFIELMAQGGIITGGLFSILLIICVFNTFFQTYRLKMVPFVFIIAIGSFISLATLSFTSKYAWLCMGIMIAVSNRKCFIFQIS